MFIVPPRRTSRAALIAALALFPSGIQAQSPAPPPVPALSNSNPNSTGEPEFSVEALVERALRFNPQLPVARENLEAARLRAGAARARQSPTVEIAPRIVGSREAAEEEIIVSQPLDVFGARRAQAEVLSAEMRRAQSEVALAQRGLRVQVKEAAAQLFAAQEAENLGAVQVEVAQLFRDAAARRAQLGDVPVVQVQRADLELLRARNELAGARAERLVRRAQVNALLGQDPQTPLRVTLPLASDFAAALRAPLSSSANSSVQTENAPSGGAPSPSGADLVAARADFASQIAARPDILGAQATLEARQAQARAIGKGRLPQIALQVRRDAVFGSGATALRAVITAPIFDFGAIGREKKAAQAEVRAQQAQINALRAQAAVQVEQALTRLAGTRQTVEIFRTGIVPQTLDLLRKTQIGYAQGASTYLEVLEAQRTLRQVQTEYLQALVGTRTGEAALESALGAAPADLTGTLNNPDGAAAPDGVAPLGTVPSGTIQPVETAPLNPPSAGDR